jgi:FkbM family methyltransferase
MAKQKHVARRLGIAFHKPNYIVKPPICTNDVIVDVGCASEPDFSMFCIGRFGARCYGVDPTRKHASALGKLSLQFPDNFIYVPLAVVSEAGFLTFHESIKHDSGSVFDTHINMRRDETQSYEVRGETLPGLLREIGIDRAKMLKLDLEGAEYELIDQSKDSDFAAFEQVFVEFHHHAFEQFSLSDTKAMVGKLEGYGFQSFSLDQHNYLFFGRAQY